MSPPRFDRSVVDAPITKAIWMIAWPTMLQNVIAGLQGLVDNAMVGHFVGYEGNAAIGVSWQIFLVVVVFISSLYGGMGVLVARFAGQGDRSKVARVVYQVMLLSLLLGIGVLAPLGFFAAPGLLALVHATPSVGAQALPYLRIMFLFSLGMMLFFMIGGALRAAGDARTPLRLGIGMTILNLLLSVVLIRGLGPIPAFGTAGAAMGTVLASLLVSGYALYLLFSGGLAIDLRDAVSFRLDAQVAQRVLRFGLPTGFQGVAMNLGGVILLRFVGSLEHSAEAQAAYAVGYSQIFAFITWTSIALMTATATVVGQSLGAERRERALEAPAAAARLGLLVAIPLGMLFLLASRQLYGIFGIENPQVLAIGGGLLAFLSLSGMFLTTALAYTGALQGSGDTRSPMYISILSQLVLPLTLCSVLDRLHGLAASDIWLAIVAGHFMRCALSVLRFGQGKWQAIRVELGGA